MEISGCTRRRRKPPTSVMDRSDTHVVRAVTTRRKRLQSTTRTKSSILSFALVVAFFWTNLAVEANEENSTPASDSCYSSINQLMQVLAADFTDFTSRQIFTLCPNTVYDLDDVDPRDEYPVLAVKSYTTIQCGDDGNSNNACVLRGGDFGLFMGPVTGPKFFHWVMTGVQIKGLTFEETRRHAVFIQNKGDITFTDCIFRNMNPTTGTILSSFDPQYGTVPGPDLVTLEFNNCLFEYIEQTKVDVGGAGGGINSNRVVEGIIRTDTPYHYLILDSCTFRHNHFPGTFKSPRGWAIKMNGGTLDIHDSCFYNNSFVGWGLVEAFGGAEVIQRDNFAEPPKFVVTEDDARYVRHQNDLSPESQNQEQQQQQRVFDDKAVSCNLIAKSSLSEPRKLSEITCYNSTESMCVKTGYIPSDFDASKSDWNNNGNNSGAIKHPTVPVLFHLLVGVLGVLLFLV